MTPSTDRFWMYIYRNQQTISQGGMNQDKTSRNII